MHVCMYVCDCMVVIMCICVCMRVYVRTHARTHPRLHGWDGCVLQCLVYVYVYVYTSTLAERSLFQIWHLLIWCLVTQSHFELRAPGTLTQT